MSRLFLDTPSQFTFADKTCPDVLDLIDNHTTCGKCGKVFMFSSKLQNPLKPNGTTIFLVTKIFFPFCFGTVLKVSNTSCCNVDTTNENHECQTKNYAAILKTVFWNVFHLPDAANHTLANNSRLCTSTLAALPMHWKHNQLAESSIFRLYLPLTIKEAWGRRGGSGLSCTIENNKKNSF